MEKKKKVVGKPFAKGTSGNPKGRPTIPFDILVAREQAAKEFLQMTLEIGELTRPDAQAWIKDDKRTLNELMIASVAIKAAKGDMQAVEFLTNRKIGKVPNPDPQSVAVTLNTPPQVVFMVEKDDEPK